MSENKDLDRDKSKETAASPSVQSAASAPVAVSAVSAETSKAAEITPSELAKESEPFVSMGRKVHNEVTYRGADWLLNSAFAVSFAYFMARTNIGKNSLSKPITDFFKVILKPVFKSDSSLQSGAEWGTRFLSIMAGGTAIIPLVKKLEEKDNKKNLVRWLDKKYYGDDVIANDPRFEESYKEIDAEPHKSMAIGHVSRYLVLAPLIGMTVTPALNNPMRKFAYAPIAKASKWLSTKIGIKPSANMLDPLKGDFIVAEDGVKKLQSNWDFIHETIGFDVSLTLLYSFMHERVYKTLASWGVKETDQDTKEGQQYAPVETISSPTSGVDLLAPISIKEENYHTKRVKPATKLTFPNELHTQRLEIQDMSVSAGRSAI